MEEEAFISVQEWKGLESNIFFPIVAAAAALVGLAYFGHCWHKRKLQLPLGKQPPSNNKELIRNRKARLLFLATGSMFTIYFIY